MRLHDLKPAPGSTKDRKRLGRGNATGQGTTAGKGTKGEKARSGGLKAGFRGMSSRNARVAKRRGFTNIFKTEYQILNVERLNNLEAGVTVDPATLAALGLVSRSNPNIKILGDGEITVPLNLVGVKVSKTARQKIEAAGGTVAGDELSDQEAAVAALSNAEVVSDTSGS